MPEVLLELKDVAATQLQRTHTPESYSVDFQPTCDGGRGRLDARYQYPREVQTLLDAFYRGLQLLLEAAACADSSMPCEITAHGSPAILDLGQNRRRYPEQGEQVVVPRARMDVEEKRP